MLWTFLVKFFVLMVFHLAFHLQLKHLLLHWSTSALPSSQQHRRTINCFSHSNPGKCLDLMLVARTSGFPGKTAYPFLLTNPRASHITYEKYSPFLFFIKQIQKNVAVSYNGQLQRLNVKHATTPRFLPIKRRIQLDSSGHAHTQLYRHTDKREDAASLTHPITPSARPISHRDMNRQSHLPETAS